MEKEKLDDKTLDKIAGGNEHPASWICPHCNKEIFVCSFEEKNDHMKKCSENPLLTS